jgi:formylmethanofuran dehydrogenase subunit E
MEQGNRSRKEIEDYIKREDLKNLLMKSAELHGHLCNYLAYGVIAGLEGLKRLGIENTGMEELIAILETNNCFSDGVQMVTGCSFGNNALIYRDFGKTAVTFSRRNGNSVRLILNPEFEDTREEVYPEAYDLFNKLVANREEGTPEEYAKMMELFADMTIKELSVPAEEMFDIKKSTISLPDFAPIFDSVKCSVCGENVMITRTIETDDGYKCYSCSGDQYSELNGSGIEKSTD